MLRLAFLVPDLEIGGGVSVMRSHARVAHRAGHHVTVVSPHRSTSVPQPQGDVPSVVSLDIARTGEYDAVIATWWADLRLLPVLRAGHHVLFLQGMADRIYADDDPRRQLARSAMSVPLPGIAVAHSLRDAFRAEYGRELTVVTDGIDKSTFSLSGPTIEPRRERIRVLVEGPLGVRFKNVLPSLRLAREHDVETWLLTSTGVGPLWGVDRVFSRLDPRAVAAVYRSCDVLLKLSTVEGLGLPPLEMFHCGGTVIAFDITGVSDYARHDVNALLARAEDFSTASAHIGALCSDPSLLARLKRGATDTARTWPSEEEAGRQFTREIEAIVARQPRTSGDNLAALTAIPVPSTDLRPGIRDRVRSSRAARSVYHSFQLRRPA
jgi:glycosyltransferase involved in cell wall biosynthesis